MVKEEIQKYPLRYSSMFESETILKNACLYESSAKICSDQIPFGTSSLKSPFGK